jgi:hypothetical protein
LGASVGFSALSVPVAVIRCHGAFDFLSVDVFAIDIISFIVAFVEMMRVNEAVDSFSDELNKVGHDGISSVELSTWRGCGVCCV